MKFSSAAAAACALFGCALLPAQTSDAPKKKPVVINLDEPAAAAASQPTSAKPAAAVPASSPEAKVDKKTAAKKTTGAAEVKIPGVVVARAKGGFLGITIENSTFRIAFYDAKKKPAAADVGRALLRWKASYQKADERSTLERDGTGMLLAGGKAVRPPFAFKLYVTFVKDALPAEAATGPEGLGADESYVVDFRG